MSEPYLKTILWAATPFLELRASIPLGYARYHLSIYESAILSIVSIVLTTAVLLYILPFLVRFLKRFIPPFHRILQKIMDKTHAKHSHKMDIIGDIALISFVAIPLPGSGAWTGVLVAYLFGVPYKKSLFLISTGIVLSAIIVSFITLFADGMWEFFIKK